MKSLRAAAVVLALSLADAGRPPVSAENIYKWTDDQGRVHYSNRGSESSADSESGETTSSGAHGWESVLERQKGTEDFQQKADATINNLELRMTRKRRERSRALDELRATQAEIARATGARAADLPALKEREATQIGQLQNLDRELGQMQTDIAKIRAMKAVEKEAK